MTVRRLAPESVQPKSFAFNAENEAWVKLLLSRYPEGRQASGVIPMLMRAQDQEGWVSEAAIVHIAERLGMAKIRVLEVATFYTQFQLAPVGTVAHVQVCGTTPCMLRGAEDIKKVCQNRIHHDQFHVTADGKFSWEEVECLGACVNAPMAIIGKDPYEDLSVESFNAILDEFEAGRTPKPGPQVDRQLSAPQGGQTTLTDASIYGTDTPIAAFVTGGKASSAAPVAVAAPAEEIVSDEFKPVLLKQANAGGPDDLELIWGVGPKLAAMLNGMGVFHFAQIAEWSEMNLKWVDQNLGSFKGRAVRDKWIEQSKKLASGWRPSNSIGDKPE